MTAEHIKSKITEWIKFDFLWDKDISQDKTYMEQGILDSMGIMELIVKLESEFGIKISDVEITEENLGGISKTSDFILRKMEKM